MTDGTPTAVLDDPHNRALIDMARALAILQVIAFHVHYGFLLLLPRDQRVDFASEYPSLLSVNWQGPGVDLIFVVSAFLLTHALIAEHRGSGGIVWRDYLLRRVSRILPLYYLALLLFSLATGASLGEVAAAALFLGIPLTGSQIIPVGWSMEAMIQVYLVLPVAVALLARCRHPFLWLAALTALSLAGRALVVWTQNEPAAQLMPRLLFEGETSATIQAIYYYSWFRLPPFLAGIALAWAVCHHEAPLRRALSRAPVWLGVSGLALALLWLGGAVPAHDPDAWPYRLWGETAWRLYWVGQNAALGAGAALAALVLFMAAPLRGRVARRLAGLGLWRRFSSALFGVYLFHFPLIALAAVIVFRSTDRAALLDATLWHLGAMFLVASALSLALGLFLTRFVERPAQRWLRQFAKTP